MSESVSQNNYEFLLFVMQMLISHNPSHPVGGAALGFSILTLILPSHWMRWTFKCTVDIDRLVHRACAARSAL